MDIQISWTFGYPAYYLENELFHKLNFLHSSGMDIQKFTHVSARHTFWFSDCNFLSGKYRGEERRVIRGQTKEGVSIKEGKEGFESKNDMRGVIKSKQDQVLWVGLHNCSVM